VSEKQFDYIIVGAGSAGCALAARLTESGKYRVLLLEAGGEDRSIWIHLPLGVGKLLTNERYVWKFQTEPQGELHGKRLYWPRGKVLGGSSAVNGMAYVWGDPHEFDRWSASGLAGWSFADVEPYFRRLESNEYTTSARRGHTGPVKITDRRARDPDVLSDAFIAACKQAGVAETSDYNTEGYEGVRYLEQTVYHGRRWSTATGYLRHAGRRRNLQILTNAVATRVIFDGARAIGVEYIQAGAKTSAKAEREIVLAAGAIQSPQLLELSGIGDPAILAPLGIPVVAAVPAVGEHMVDHLQVRCSYRTNVPITINDIVRSPWHKVRFGIKYLVTRRGLLAGTSSTAHAITRTRVGLNEPDVMVRIYHISGRDRLSRSKGAGIDPYSGFSIGGFTLHPRSRGSIHIRSRDPSEHPRIDPRYFSDPQDRTTAVAMLRLIRKIAAQPAFQPYILREDRPGSEIIDDDGLLEYARETGQTAWHAVATCRMAAHGLGVVDTRLRVNGVSALRVVDVSVLPSIPSSNTNAAAIMVGERGADFVMEDAK